MRNNPSLFIFNLLLVIYIFFTLIKTLYAQEINFLQYKTPLTLSFTSNKFFYLKLNATNLNKNQKIYCSISHFPKTSITKFRYSFIKSENIQKNFKINLNKLQFTQVNSNFNTNYTVNGKVTIKNYYFIDPPKGENNTVLIQIEAKGYGNNIIIVESSVINIKSFFLTLTIVLIIVTIIAIFVVRFLIKKGILKVSFWNSIPSGNQRRNVDISNIYNESNYNNYNSHQNEIDHYDLNDNDKKDENLYKTVSNNSGDKYLEEKPSSIDFISNENIDNINTNDGNKNNEQENQNKNENNHPKNEEAPPVGI